MDELEISGKRYISAKRAGKENKYHPDYIGQLIRAKKVEGQKVGRAWYVVADSLSAYLAKEPQTHAPTASVVKQKPQPVHIEEETIGETPMQESVVEPAMEEPAPQIAETFIEEEVAEVREIKKVVAARAHTEDRNEYHIPVKISQRAGLRYLPDNEPLFPAIKKTKEHPMAHVQVMPTQFIEEEEQEKVVVRPQKQHSTTKRSSLFRAGAVLVFAGAVFALAALLSMHLISVTTVKEGQPASVGYSLE